MIDAVLAYLDLHASEISEASGFGEAITQVQDLAEAIWVKDNEKTVHTSGKYTKKKNSGEALAKQVLKISAGLFLWAKKNNNTELKELADITKSRFVQLRDAEKFNVAKSIFGAATGKDMAFAKVTPADITKLDTLADDFKKDIAGMSSGASKRIAAGESLESMINEAMEIVKEDFDKYMLQYAEDKPEFYTGYKSARVIWDKGGKQKEEQPAVPVNP